MIDVSLAPAPEVVEAFRLPPGNLFTGDVKSGDTGQQHTPKKQHGKKKFA
jgi:hypothetical protein